LVFIWLPDWSSVTCSRVDVVTPSSIPRHTRRGHSFLNQIRCSFVEDKVGLRPEKAASFAASVHPENPERLLKFLSGAGGVPAVALQLDRTLRRLAVGRTVLLPRRSHTHTPIHRAFLRVSRHKTLLVSPCVYWDAGRPSGDAATGNYLLVSSRCAACFRLVSVSLAPLSMRAISCVRSESSMRRTSVWVRPRFSVFSIRKCWSPNAAI
jgi:hypothetical protein